MWNKLQVTHELSLSNVAIKGHLEHCKGLKVSANECIIIGSCIYWMCLMVREKRYGTFLILLSSLSCIYIYFLYNIMKHNILIRIVHKVQKICLENDLIKSFQLYSVLQI